MNLIFIYLENWKKGIFYFGVDLIFSLKGQFG